MADSKPAKTTKRRLKAPSQTVREQAEKAQSTEKPVRGRRLRTAASNTSRPLRKLAPLFDRQPFKFILRILRIIGRILVPGFIRNAFAELKLVTWPNRRETWRLTFAVLAFAVVFGAVITAVDYGLDKAFKAIILK